MSAWALNAVALFIGGAAVFALASALLWRIGSWHVSPAASLTLDEGLVTSRRLV